jgi:hypothetical protein
VDLPSLVDDALEVTVVGSFSRVGFVLRRLLFGWAPPADGALRGRTALVTGPTSGLGRAATDALASMGARVILVGRSAERLAAVRDALVATHGEDRFPIVVADTGSLASVRAAADRIIETEPRLDVLVDNAGAIFPERSESPDGIEATLAVLVVGPFVLVSGLLPLLRRTPGARVVCVTSGGMYTQKLDLDDLQSTVVPFSGPACLRSREAGPGRPRPGVGAPPARDRRHDQRDASRLGRHAGPRGDAAGLLPRHAPRAAKPGGGGGHDRLAGRRPGGRGDERVAVPGPAAAALRPGPRDAAERGGSPAPLGHDRGAVRGARPCPGGVIERPGGGRSRTRGGCVPGALPLP